jgi:asparagine synthase (glutamine-hydrolysing)
MCGFAGFLSTSLPRHAPRVLRQMNSAIQDRGPDSEGQWIDEAAGVALGHRRLSIVDLSAAGHQPMVSASGRFVISFNGEIYNHKIMRVELEESMSGPGWRGYSDTETLLTGIERWGLFETLRRATGMFGLALWDRQRRELHLARDRMGEKPVYYGWQGVGGKRTFLFGSDLKALWSHPSFEFDIDRTGLTSLLQLAYVAQPLSIFKGISKLEPGTIATTSLERPQPLLGNYWHFQEVVNDCFANPLTGAAEETTAELERLLKQAISMQMEADVPVGAFLSGGVDSSTIVALMQEIARERGQQPVRTFTIGFENKTYDEAPFAAEVARHLGTDHSERYVTSTDVQDVIPQLPSIYSEPFADSSQIPTYLVSGLARGCVTVSLSGDAGDELFCGYTRYMVGHQLINKLSASPKWARDLALVTLQHLSHETLARIYNKLQPLLPKRLRFSNAEDKLGTIEKLLESDDCARSTIYNLLISQWQNAADVVLGGREVENWSAVSQGFDRHAGFVDQMMLADVVGYLPNDILCKVDRAAMAVSLETRMPLLDHAIVEHALRMPLAHKLNNGTSKWPLREILYKRVPRKLIERPKKGFAVPLGDWMKGTLRPWTEELLGERRLREEGFFDAAQIRCSIDRHMTGRGNESSRLWCVLMFQAWYDSNREKWAQIKAVGETYV